MSDTTPARDTHPVTVIGLGPMGQAMTRVLLAGGHPVTVWNRTPARADGVVADGATLAATPDDALAAADIVILSLTDYEAMYDILGQDGPADAAADPLAGRTLVNLSSDTPGRTREAATWAARRGAAFVAGGVMVPAVMVGTDGAYTYYSGPRSLFERYEPTLRLLSEPRYVGADPGLAQLYYQAHLDIFLTTLSAVLHATALVGSAGVTAAEFLPDAIHTVVTTPEMMGATADHIVGASHAAGIDVALPEAVRSHYERAIAAGHAKDSWTSLFEAIKVR